MAAHCYPSSMWPATRDVPAPDDAGSPAGSARRFGPQGRQQPTGRVAGLRIALVVTSSASPVPPRNRVVVPRRLSGDHDVGLVEPTRRGHATRFAHDAARRGADVVV